MHHDPLGNPVTGDTPATLRALDDFVEGYLAYETRAEGILGAAQADPASCLANVYAGYLWMLLEAPEGASHAATFLAAAQRTAVTATRREQMNAALLEAWVAGDLADTILWCDRISDEFPRDLVVVKTHQYFEFNRGNSPEMLRVALKVLTVNAEVPALHGMLAFAYEQCHLLDEAAASAQTALALRRKEPWAQHAMAHVLLTRGRIDAGARFLEEVADTWTGLNSFMITHLWWHLALFYLSQGRHARVLEIYDRHCWGVAKDYSQDQIGAVSLLARMELAGIEVGARWQQLGRYLAARVGDTEQPFLTMQYLYGLARAGRPEASSLLDAVRCRAAKSGASASASASASAGAGAGAGAVACGVSDDVWHAVALSACEGLFAHAQGRHDAAWRHLGAVLPRLIEAGGSHAQRDLFDLLVLDAALRSGRWVAAQQLLEKRRMSDPQGVPVNAALALVYARLGLTGLAQQAASRVHATHSLYADGIDQRA